MEKEDNYSAGFLSLDFPLDQDQPNILKHQENSGSTDRNDSHEIGLGGGRTDGYMLHNTAAAASFHHPPPMGFSGFMGSGSSLDKISFADVMQFADFGPKLGLNQTKSLSDSGVDPVCFLKFPVLNDRQSSLMGDTVRLFEDDQEEDDMQVREEEEEEARVSENTNDNPVQQRSVMEDTTTAGGELKSNKKKRPRTTKTNEEVESQRMTHIAVERNRRRQMNDHLRVLRSLMPGSYVQRGDQASIIGGAIEFVRELEQLLQCLESQKRRRLYGDGVGMSQQQPPSIVVPNVDQTKVVDFETGLREETAESKSCHADVEVKVLGFDAMIKILSKRRPGQLIKTIVALEDLQLNILHTNITTIEHTVLYSFNVKIASDRRLTAEDVANSVQQIFSFIHANSSI